VLDDAAFDPAAEFQREVAAVPGLDCLRAPAEQSGVEGRCAGAIAGLELQVDDRIEARRSHSCFVRPAEFAELIGRAMSFGAGVRLPW
jgi:hypothetical protein